jgi:hypothetical protein
MNSNGSHQSVSANCGLYRVRIRRYIFCAIHQLSECEALSTSRVLLNEIKLCFPTFSVYKVKDKFVPVLNKLSNTP